MKTYLLLTKFNKEKSDQLKDAVQSLSLNLIEVSEFFDEENDGFRYLSVQNVPSVVSVYEAPNGENILLKQTDNPYQLVTFESDSQAILDALNQQ